MQSKMKIATGIMTLCVAVTAQAGQLVDQRGYQQCVDGIESELNNQRPHLSHVYFMTVEDDNRTYYINGTAWQDGQRQPVRSECMTSLGGNHVLALAIEPGSYRGTPAARVEIEVAVR